MNGYSTAFWLDSEKTEETLYERIKGNRFLMKLTSMVKETLRKDESLKRKVTESVRSGLLLNDLSMDCRSPRSVQYSSNGDKRRLLKKIREDIQDSVVENISETVDELLSEGNGHPIGRMLQDRIQMKTEDYYHSFSRDEILKVIPSTMISDSPINIEALDEESTSRRQKRRCQSPISLSDPLSPVQEDPGSDLKYLAIHDEYRCRAEEICRYSFPHKTWSQGRIVERSYATRRERGSESGRCRY